MIDEKYLKKIVKNLDLERIVINETITLICIPKKVNKEFIEKFYEEERELNKISHNVILKYVEEGEIDNVKRIEFPPKSTSDGVT